MKYLYSTLLLVIIGFFVFTVTNLQSQETMAEENITNILNGSWAVNLLNVTENDSLKQIGVLHINNTTFVYESFEESHHNKPLTSTTDQLVGESGIVYSFNYGLEGSPLGLIFMNHPQGSINCQATRLQENSKTQKLAICTLKVDGIEQIFDIVEEPSSYSWRFFHEPGHIKTWEIAKQK